MTKYQMLVAGLFIVSVLSAILEASAGKEKGIMYQLHVVFEALTLIAVLALVYRAFK